MLYRVTTMKNGKYIWIDGAFVEFEKATVHVLTHGLHYGTGVYEGLRCYDTIEGPGIFRPREHYKRLLDGAKVIRLIPQQMVMELVSITKELIKKNEFKECYIRPIIFYSCGEMGLDITKNGCSIAIATWEWGAYLGEKGLGEGIRCKVSKVRRIDRESMPAGTKVCGNYVNSVLATMDAKEEGFDDSIMLTKDNRVAECTGANIFLIKNEVIYTPSLDAGIVPGITRESIMEICRNSGRTVIEKDITVDELFDADEIFLTGTATEVAAVRMINETSIGKGMGKITKKIRREFFEITRGKNKQYSKWIELVDG